MSSVDRSTANSPMWEVAAESERPNVPKMADVVTSKLPPIVKRHRIRTSPSVTVQDWAAVPWDSAATPPACRTSTAQSTRTHDLRGDLARDVVWQPEVIR